MVSSKKLWIFIFIVFLFNILTYIFKWGGEIVLLYVSDILPVICSFIAAFFLLLAYKSFRTFDYIKIAWLLIFIGIVLDFAAESTYGYLEISKWVDVNVVFPTVADYIWCLAYIPMFIGLAMIFIGYSRSGFPMGNIKAYTVISAIVLMLFVLVIIHLLIPIITDDETELEAKIFYLIYPIADLLVVIPIVVLIYITSLFRKELISMPWRYLAIGFALFAVADLLYSYLNWLDLYDVGSVLDIAWNMGYLLIALSGLYQKQLIDSINIRK